jgi:hypothetical protein
VAYAANSSHNGGARTGYDEQDASRTVSLLAPHPLASTVEVVKHRAEVLP